MSKRRHSAQAKLTNRELASRRARVVRLVQKLPEAAVIQCGTHLSLEVRGKRFGWYLENHHNDGRLALNCRTSPGASEALVTAASEKFHIPKYLGHRGWLGLWLDLPHTDWSEVEALLTEAYVVTAPKSLAKQLGPSE